MSRALSALELLNDYGDAYAAKPCGCCGKRTLYEVKYPDSRGSVLLCARCDVDRSPQP